MKWRFLASHDSIQLLLRVGGLVRIPKLRDECRAPFTAVP